MFNHPCIKCGAQYQDEDPDAYYCSACLEEKKKIAADLDAKRPKSFHIRETTALEVFESKGKTMPSAKGGLATFVRASDLM